MDDSRGKEEFGLAGVEVGKGLCFKSLSVFEIIFFGVLTCPEFSQDTIKTTEIKNTKRFFVFFTINLLCSAINPTAN
mgnify:FL=1